MRACCSGFRGDQAASRTVCVAGFRGLIHGLLVQEGDAKPVVSGKAVFRFQLSRSTEKDSVVAMAFLQGSEAVDFQVGDGSLPSASLSPHLS